MNPHSAHSGEMPERLELDQRGSSLRLFALVAGAAGLIVAAGWSLVQEHGLRRFLFAYLVSYLFFLSIALGALFFVLLHHVTRAGWSTVIRRWAEQMAATLPVLGVLALPILISVWSNNGALYKWAQPLSAIHEDHLLAIKRPYLNPGFFTLRLIIYFVVWSGIALWYRRLSLEQDSTRNPDLTRRMEKFSAPGLVIYAITVTGAAFDLIMSLDPHWYSTIFGVYYFAGAMVAIYASLILAGFFLQRFGYLRSSVTTEHYHDLGKFLFGFVFFWGYIAFSQYMLMWYGNIPEETAWYARRGATTVRADINGFTVFSLILLFCHLLIPFGGLLSRHVKRHRSILVFWALWMLIFHWVDCYWLVMPEMGAGVRLGVPEIFALIGIGGLWKAELLRRASASSLRPVGDPRLEEALVFQNV